MAKSEKFNSKLIFTTIAASVGAGFVSGYHTAVTNVPELIIKDWLNKTYEVRTGTYMDQDTQDALWGVIAAMINVGGIFGGLLVGIHTRRFGPRTALLLTNILVLTAAILLGISKPVKSMETLITGRFVVGLNIGLNVGLCSMYLSEVAPVRLRGAVSSSYQLALTCALLLSQIIGLPCILGTERLWPYLFVVPVFIGAFQVATLSFCPESPRYLISIGKEEEAKKALQYLRMCDDVTEDMDLIKSEDDNVKNLPEVSLTQVCHTRQLKIPLLISVVVHVAQQSCGINAILFFSTSTFIESGFSTTTSKYFTTVIGIIMIIMTIISLFLVEKAGRKTLLLKGFGGMAVILITFSISLKFAGKNNEPLAWLCLILIYLFVIFYAIGPGPITWFLVSEIFNQAARPTAVAVTVAVNCLTNVIVTFIFPWCESKIGSYIFLIFGLLDVVYFIFIWKFVPETKNRPVDDIISHWA